MEVKCREDSAWASRQRHCSTRLMVGCKVQQRIHTRLFQQRIACITSLPLLLLLLLLLQLHLLLLHLCKHSLQLCLWQLLQAFLPCQKWKRRSNNVYRSSSGEMSSCRPTQLCSLVTSHAILLQLAACCLRMQERIIGPASEGFLMHCIHALRDTQRRSTAIPHPSPTAPLLVPLRFLLSS